MHHTQHSLTKSMESYYEDFFQAKSVKPQPKKNLQNTKHILEQGHSPQSDSQNDNQDQELQPPQPKFQRPSYTAKTQEAINKIYISNMKNGTDEHQLRKMFIKFGDISSVTHRGTYAFVEFIEPEAAQNAIREMADKGEMRVQKAYSKQQQSSGSGHGGYEKTHQYGKQDYKNQGYYPKDSPSSNTSAETKRIGAGSTSGVDSCFKCGQTGHWASKCPNGQMGGTGQLGGKGYNKSGQYGGSGQNSGGNDGQKCFNCQGSGHWSRDCPKPRRQNTNEGAGYKRFKSDF